MAAETVSQDSSWIRMEDLANKLAMLETLLIQTHGNGRESFLSLGENRQEFYLWHCTDVASDCVKEAKSIMEQCLTELRQPAHKKAEAVQ